MPPEPSRPVERLFPFVLRSKIHVIGIQAVLREKKHLLLLFVARDLSANSSEKLIHGLNEIPQVRCYDSESLSRFFAVPGLKVLGLKKSPLAHSIYNELKSQGKTERV